jgi:hypothetical protein
MNKFLAVFVLCFAASMALRWTPGQFEFANFMKTFNKTYANEAEFNTRFAVFTENMQLAAQAQAVNPKARFGVTQFMDLSAAEFKRGYLNAGDMKSYVAPPTKTTFVKPVNAPNPTNYDWSQAGVITPVYNQGQCGSCWAFSATETIESYWALAGKGLTGLSMEQIVDCDTTCYGCGGGWPYLAYQYVQGQGGIDSYASYPYTAGGGQSGSCAYSASNVVAQVTGYQTITGEAGLYQQLSTGGPVSVCVDASSWQYYQGGVLTTCGTSVDHCVQATGYYNYGSSSAYWNVRNSWATSWGINGYIWIAIGQDLCDIGDYATIVNV